MITVEDAVLALAGARKFRPADIGLGHGSAARIRMKVALPADVRGRLHRLLADYTRDLSELGVEYSAIDPPTASVAGVAVPVASARKPIGRSRVWVEGDALWLKSPYEARDTVRELIPSAVWSKSKVAYKLPATPQAAISVADALGAYGVDGDDASGVLLNQARSAKAAQGLRSRVDLPQVPGSKTNAWEHQRQAFWFARELKGAILDMEMGTGKSKVVVDLIHDSGAESVMIMCPERVVGVWPKQFGIHSGGEKHIIDPRRQKRTGQWELLPISDRVALYDHALHDCRCGLPHVLMTNYAASAYEPFKSWSLRQGFDYIAYDECHRLRSHSGVWSKWAEKMVPRAERRIGGTGTLQAQTPLDVFGQVRAVEPGLFGSTYVGFRKRYAIMGGYEGKKVVDYQREDELAEKLSQVTFHAGEDVLDLPEMLPDISITGSLSPRAHKAYVALEQELYAEVVRELEDGSTITEEATADNVLVRILRCQQITGGALPFDSGHVEEIDHAKADLLFEELSDLPCDPDDPVVVFARFHHDLAMIERVAGRLAKDRGTAVPHGELSGRRSDALASDATLAEGIAVAGVQIQAGGTGVDFTRSAYGFYYSVGHSLGDYLQSRKRLHRPGQTRSTRFRHLVMEGTIDEEVYEALAARQSVVERIAAKVKGLQDRRAL